MESKNRQLSLVAAEETDRISRYLLAWLRTWPDNPLPTVQYEYLPADGEGMALSTIQGAYKTREYILGGYEAEYQFKIIYRVQPTGDTGRLSADELLNAFAIWATNNYQQLSIGEGKTVKQIVNTARSSLFARYENGDEDHQTLLTLTYEVF